MIAISIFLLLEVTTNQKTSDTNRKKNVTRVLTLWDKTPKQESRPVLPLNGRTKAGDRATSDQLLSRSGNKLRGKASALIQVSIALGAEILVKLAFKATTHSE